MIIRKIAGKRRAKVKSELYKKAIQDIESDRKRFLSIRECCELLSVDPSTVKLPQGASREDVFTCICAWDYYLIPGCLYAALPLYANLSSDKAMERGAKVLLTDKQEQDYPCIIVDDVMAAYCKLCGHIREQSSFKTVAVTGSVGKTTTKDMIKAVFSQRYKTFCDVENNNMATLVGYLVQHIPNGTEAYIQEVHEGDPGSAESISKIIHPDVAVITNIGESHLGNFGSYDDLVKGVTDITAAMPKDGIVVIDGDDAPSVSAPWDKKVVKISVKNQTADYYAEKIQTTEDGLVFNIAYSGGRIEAVLNMYGAHNVTDALLAFAAGVESGVSAEQAVRGLQSYVPKGMRQNVVKAGNRILYIDCFNAAVKSMRTALDTLGELSVKQGGKRIAVLGDMAELGEDAASMHRRVGEIAAISNLDTLICYGPLSAGMAEEARKFSRLKVFHTESMTELNRLVKEQVGPNDAVLFKAGHSTNLIATVKANYPLTYFKAIYIDRLQRHFARTSSLK